MNKIYSFLLNAVLFSVLFLFWVIAYIIAAGFLEIAFKWNLESRGVLGIILLLTLTTTLFLYFYLPLKRYRGTPGWGIISRIKGEEPGLTPVVFYCKVLGIMVIAYFLTWGASIIIFSPMVKEQEKVLESMGMSLDWRSYYPEWDEKDNAAPYLKQAWAGLKKETYERAGELLDLLKKNSDSIKDISGDIDNLLKENAESVKLIDEALKFNKLAWVDYRKFSSSWEVPIPQYSMFRGFTLFCILDAINSASRNDYQQAEKSINRAIGLLKLMEQEPEVISLLIRMGSSSHIYEGLSIIVKIRGNAPEGFAFIKKITDTVPSFYDSARKGLKVQYSSMYGIIQKPIFLKTFFNDAIAKGGIFYIFYNIWELWNRYCLLKIAEFDINYTKPDNTQADRAEIRKQHEKFRELNERIPAYLGMQSVGNFASYSLREAETMARANAVLLFAAAIDYHRKYGRYPETLDKLVPEYFKELPKSPVDGKPYIYNTSKDFMEVYIIGAENKHIPDTTVIGESPSKS